MVKGIDAESVKRFKSRQSSDKASPNLVPVYKRKIIRGFIRKEAEFKSLSASRGVIKRVRPVACFGLLNRRQAQSPRLEAKWRTAIAGV